MYSCAPQIYCNYAWCSNSVGQYDSAGFRYTIQFQLSSSPQTHDLLPWDIFFFFFYYHAYLYITCILKFLCFYRQHAWDSRCTFFIFYFFFAWPNMLAMWPLETQPQRQLRILCFTGTCIDQAKKQCILTIGHTWNARRKASRESLSYVYTY